MSLHRFFLPQQVITKQQARTFRLELAPDDEKHAKVLRLKTGEHVAVIDAEQDYFECEVAQNGADGLFVSVAQHVQPPLKSVEILLFQGLAKGDKIDEVIRHATELGVSSFVPLACSRSIVKLDYKKARSRLARWEAIAKSAAMQSGQDALPNVEPVCNITSAHEQLTALDALLVCWEEAPQSKSLHSALAPIIEQRKKCPKVGVVVGPEGGLTNEEVQLLLQSNTHAQLVSLGSSILRTETAGIVAPALVAYEFGMLGGRTTGGQQ